MIARSGFATLLEGNGKTDGDWELIIQLTDIRGLLAEKCPVLKWGHPLSLSLIHFQRNNYFRSVLYSYSVRKLLFSIS